jgi:GTP-binding protein SAR1
MDTITGKTTLLHSLATGQNRLFPPTDRPRIESFKYKGISFRAWDLGGHEAVRHLWADYYDGSDMDDSNTRSNGQSSSVSAVLFLVDASDIARLEEAGYELDHLLAPPMTNNNNSHEPTIQQQQSSALHNVPVAVLCNKCDLDSAAASSVIAEKLDYARLEQMHAPNKLAMFRISVLTGQGYDEAFQWINSFL